MVGLPAYTASCDERLSSTVTWSRYRNVLYATVVLKATLRLRHGMLAKVIEPLAVRWSDTYRESGALERADESASFSGGGAVLVHGFFHSPPGASLDNLAIARVAVGTDKPVVDKVIGARQSGRIPLAWERALLTLDNPAGTQHPILINPKDMSKSVGLGPIAPSWATRANLLFAPINVRDHVFEVPERIDPRFFNPAPLDQQCQPLSGSEGIVLQNLVENVPELQTWLPALSLVAWISVNGAPVQAAFFLDTLVIDAEAGIANTIWRAVTPLPEGTTAVAVDAKLAFTDQPDPVVQVVVERETFAAQPVAAVPTKPARVLPTEPRQLTKVPDPRRALPQRAAARQSLENLDLENADLHGLDLSGLSLAGSKLDGANLRGANLQGSNLWATTWIGADLAGAALDGADLESANFSRAKGQKATFRKAMLPKANLSKARFDGAVFDDADLTDCEATGVALTEAKLRRAKLNRAMMDGALLVGAELNDAWLDFAKLNKCSMDEVSFDGASLTDAEMAHSVADRASFMKARLARVVLSRARLTGANLTGADMASAKLDGAEMSNTHLAGALLDHADARGAKLGRADLSGASLCNANLAGADLSGARLTKAKRDGANLEGAKLANVIE